MFNLPPFTKFLSRKEWIEICWQEISRSGDLRGLPITPSERRNIVMRIAIINNLRSGKGIRQIARELQISSQTINTVKKSLSENKYRSYRERGKTDRKKKIYDYHPSQNKHKDHRRYRRTKYGKVYLP